MNDKNIQQMIKQFESNSSEVSNTLMKMLSKVNDGYIPSDSEMADAQASLANLKDTYNSIYNYTKEVLGDAEELQSNDSVYKYERQLMESQIIAARKKIEKASDILRRFNSIIAIGDKYKKAIASFKDDAERMLCEINNRNPIEASKNLPDVSSHKLFLDAIVEEDEDRLDEMAELITDEFNYTASLGIIRKKYTLANQTPTRKVEAEEKPSKQPIPAEIKPIEPKPEKIVEVPVIDEQGKQSKEPELDEINKHEEKDSLYIEDKLKEASTAAKKTKPTATMPKKQEGAIRNHWNPAENMKTMAVLNQLKADTEEKDTTPVTKLISKEKLKTSTPSAAAFKKDILKLSHTCIGVHCILPILTNLGMLTAEQIYTCGVCLKSFKEEEKEKNLVLESVKTLARKGFLVAYDYEDTTVYCLSNYSYSSMHKDTIMKNMKDFWEVNYGSFKLIGQETIEISEVDSIMSVNNALIRYMYSCLNQFEYDIVATINTSILWDGNNYSLKVWDGKEFHDCVLVNDKTDLTSLDCTKLLYIDEKEIPENMPETMTKVFKFNDNSIFTTFSKVEDEEDIAEPEEVIAVDTTIETSEEKTIPEQEESETTIGFAEQETMPEESICEDIAEEPMATTPKELLNLKTRVPREEEFTAVLNSLLSSKKVGKEAVKSVIVQSVLLARAASFIKDYDMMKILDKQLQLATNIIITDVRYQGMTISDTFSSLPTEDPCISYAAYAFAMLIPAEPYDHAQINSIKQCFDMYDQKYGELPPKFKQLFNSLMQVTNYIPTGFSPSMIAGLGNEKEKESYLLRLSRTANENLKYTLPKTKMKILPKFYNSEFGEKSDIYESLKVVIDNNMEAIDIVEACLSTYCMECKNTYVVSQAKLEEKLAEKWAIFTEDKKHTISYVAKSQTINQYATKLNILKSWYEHVKSNNMYTQELSKIKSLRKELVETIESLQKDSSYKKLNNSIVLTWMLIRMEEILTGKLDDTQLFSDLLHTGIISIDQEGKPLLNEQHQQIPYYEPWRNVLKHITTRPKDFSTMQTEITSMPETEASLTRFDNLQQLRMIGKIMDDNMDYEVSEEMLKDAEHYANCVRDSLLQDLEMAYTYGRINEQEKETIEENLKNFEQYFYEINDFACWRDFLYAARKNIEVCQERNKVKIQNDLNSRLQLNPESKLLLRANKLFSEEQNFAVAEEYINRFDSGDTSLLNISDSPIAENNYFLDFIEDRKFMELYNVCHKHKGSQLLKYGADYIDKHHPASWTNRNIEDSKKCISKWPSSRNTTSPQTLEAYFTSLGFDVTNATKDNNGTTDLFLLKAKPTPKSKSDYTHPIAQFGTRMQNPISVIVLYGNREPKELLDEITSLDRRGISIVLLDYFVTVSYRRQLCAYFHQQTSRQNPFLLIDQVLALYLAMLPATERIPAMLKCTLPFATCQPFLTDKADSVADEMFYGRSQELASIMNSNGASIVYGGRQLGKTALLQRAESLMNKPNEKRYAVYTNIMSCTTEEALVKKLITEIEISTNDSLKVPKCNTLEDFCNNIAKMFANGKINYLMLLMDEADNFLKSIADNSYSNLQSLVELKRRNANFKFVLAGLHNVCRAKNATRANGIFGQLGEPLCVKPLPPVDALALLNKPLNYLGFTIDKDSHLETILTNTNYYPGLIQFFGYKLVETLADQYPKYYSAQNGNPPFNLNETQLGYVMNSADLNTSIKNKFKLTLELDPRYFMLARCITLLYDLYGESISATNCFGYTIAEIKEIADSYEIKCLAAETEDSYEILLDEMEEMGVLSKPEKGIYKLRRISFVDIIGNDADLLEAEILENNN